MALSDEKKKAYAKRILLSRNRILCHHGFYGMLLMYAKFILDENCETAYTDGEKIAFSPAFMDKLSDRELDFILMHEILHIVLQHCFRGEGYDGEAFNIACDIVVNSNILKSCDMDLSTITLTNYGESMHLTPNKKEGYLFTAEEVYAMLPKEMKSGKNSDEGVPSDNASGEGDGDGENEKGGKRGGSKKNGKKGKKDGICGASWDDHSKWQIEEGDDELREIWLKRVVNVASVVSVNDPDNSCGSLPACAERILKELRKPQIDWRTMLDEFVQEEVCDYSFTPPDRRFSDSDFFLPDYNDTDIKVEDILFMVDTSGSIDDNMIAAAYSEIKGAIEQFDGKLRGMLGFFDAEVYTPVSFDSVKDVMAIRPKGGGGTSFYAIFDYVFKKLPKLPVSIVILTDGEAYFPPQSYSGNIPVLWLINNTRVDPPWGRVARIEV